MSTEISRLPRRGNPLHLRMPAIPRAQLDHTTLSGVTAVLVGCIFLQRLAVPFGAEQLPLAFPVGYGALLFLMLRRRIVLNVELCVFFLLVMASLTLSMLHSGSSASLTSFFYLFTIYVLYVFKLRFRDGEGEEILHIYGNLMAIAAGCGLAQFCLQFVLPQSLVFPLETFVPKPFLFGDLYNVIIPLTYGSAIVKSNGVFFLEPSFFSQFLAVALILELLREQRLSRLALYAAAMVVSYSGTGLLLMGLFLPYILWRRGNPTIFLIGAVGVVILMAAAASLNLDTMVNRLGEFSAPESSGFARFVSPFYLFRDFMETPSAVLFGLGPGSIDKIIAESSYKGYAAHDPTWIKAVVEYGVIAGALVILYVVAAFFKGAANKGLATALLVLCLFLGGYLLNPIMHFLFVALTVWPNAMRPRRFFASRQIPD
ncbi:MAG TPA: hypothetical protein VGO34_06405 [Alphaproteobacteria bacterium]|jgi:hypothetical protein